MGWDAQNRRMSAPVTMDDVSLALGVISSNLGELISLGVVNKWAKYKPVQEENVNHTSQLESNKTWKTTANWWKGNDGQCGMKFQTFTSLGNPDSSASFFYKLRTGQLAWEYNRPRGGGRRPAEWYRMFDLIQYYADAPSPIDGVQSTINLTQDYRLIVSPYENRGDDTTLSLADFKINNISVADFYLGMLVYYSGSQYTFVTAGRVGDGNNVCTFANMVAYAGRDVTIVPFLSSVSISQGSAPNSGIFLCVDVPPKTVHISPYVTGLQTDLSAQWREEFHVRVHYTVRLINHSTGATTVNNLVIALYRSGQQSALATRTISSQSVAADGTVDIIGTFIPNEEYYPDQTYTVVVTSTGSVASGSVVVDEPR